MICRPWCSAPLRDTFLDLVRDELREVRGRYYWKLNFMEAQCNEEEKTGLQYLTLEGLEAFLSSPFVNGIGKVLAGRIAKKTGLDILLSDFDFESSLSDIPGLTSSKISELKNSIQALRYPIQSLVLLYSAGLKDAEVEKIASHYKKKLEKVILAEPYDMVENVWKTSFFTADKVGRLLGVKADDPGRLQGALLTAVKFYAEKGHLFAIETQAVETAARLAGVSSNLVRPQLEALVDEGRLVRSLDGIYLPVYFTAEKGAAEKIRRIIKRHSPEKLIFDLPTVDIKGNPLNEGQISAIRTVMENPVTVITGGPGTGKTTAVRGIIRLYEDMGKKVILAAPTGRAAKRMTDLAGMEAKTIHRLLGYSMGRGYRNKKFDADILVIDEASMLEQVLFNHLLDAVGPDTTIVLVGDTDQLPSIGAGDVLNHLIASETVPVVNLTENFRQKEGSMIAANAEKIREGRAPESGRKEDFILVEENGGEADIKSKILDLVANEIPLICKVDPKQIQVVTPQQEGPLGAKQLNIDIQQSVNPVAPEIKRGTKLFRLGDRVMQIANSSEKQVYNGETGWVSGVDPENNTLEVTFNDGKKRSYDKSRLKELTLAYATTVHKLQGSETDYMVMLLSTAHRPLLYRNLLYTGVSRAKKLCVLLGEEKALSTALRDDSHKIRNSNFKNMLKGIAGND